MSLQGKKVLVVGTGKSGIAATELLCANGIDTVLFDGNKELDSKTLYEKAPKLKEVPLILGDLTDEQIDEFEAYESAESKFAHAMDNLQPLLLNNSNGGADWREHQVTAEQVYGRQSKTQKGSVRLYEVINQLLRENIEKGNILV